MTWHIAYCSRDAPSWLYPVRMGATTVWERWDGYTEEKGYADSGMNSFNHYAFGSVGEYLFSVIGGIKERSPGYGEFYIRPVIGRGLSWAKVSFHSIHGEIFVFWTDRGKVAEDRSRGPGQYKMLFDASLGGRR